MALQNQPSVAIIGLGNMGGAIATNLLAHGYTVHAYDIDHSKLHFYKQKGAITQVNTAQAAIKSIVTIICVVDAPQTRSVLFGSDGLAHHVHAGHTVMLCPTISPQEIEYCADQLTQRGIHTIDAPMSGGPTRAANGTMSLMVACANAVYIQHQDLINHLSSTVFRISQRPGDGARTKLVNNLLAGINLVGAAEALALAHRMGLNLQTTLDVIKQSSGQSWIGTDRMQRALQGHTAPLAHMSLLAKDTALAVQAGQDTAAGANSTYLGPLGMQVSQVFAQALAAGLSEQDDSALLKWFLRPANVQLATTPQTSHLPTE
jgi:L-threonate 2-dehydrogenase